MRLALTATSFTNSYPSRPLDKMLRTWLAVSALLLTFVPAAVAQSTLNKAPDFALPDRHGNEISLTDVQGTIVVLNFWATWCAPCRYEMPAFVRLQSKLGEKVQFVGVSVDTVGWGPINQFTDEIGVNYPIVWDPESDVIERYGDPSALPSTFLIDEEGVIRVIIAGMVSESDLEGILEMMIRGEQL
jgi:peroxiredoxin